MHKGNITAAVLAFALCAAADETIQANGYEWRCSRDGASATITGVTPSSGDISIPESLAAGGSEYPVVGIAESAFAGSAGLTGVEIPYSVTNVSARAFADCPALSCVHGAQSLCKDRRGRFFQLHGGGCRSASGVPDRFDVRHLPRFAFRARLSG